MSVPQDLYGQITKNFKNVNILLFTIHSETLYHLLAFKPYQLRNENCIAESTASLLKVVVAALPV